MLLVKNFKKNIEDDSICLISVLRDENVLIEYFIKYYKKIGITHFIFIDNGSKDGTFEYLKELDENILLYSTYDDYKQAGYGVDWVNDILNKKCKNNWCLVVDIDELIYSDNLNKLIHEMKSEGSTLCCFLLLDMYSRTEKKYKRGESFLDHSNYFDKLSNYYNLPHNYKRGITNYIHGGTRGRILNLNCCLNKVSFFYNNFSNTKLYYGYHCLISDMVNIKIHSRHEYLLHFKFIKPNFKEFINIRIKNNQDWDNSSEYKMYRKLNIYNLFHKDYSIKLENKSQLDNIFKKIVFNF